MSTHPTAIATDLAAAVAEIVAGGPISATLRAREVGQILRDQLITERDACGQATAVLLVLADTVGNIAGRAER